MHILNKLTVKHLKMNKKRTAVTIIGITLSCALMVGIGLLISSFLYSMQLDAENSYGTYHLMIQDVSEKEIEEIKANVNVKKVYTNSVVGFGEFSSNSSKPFILVENASPEFLKEVKLVEGRLPENEREIVLTTTYDSYKKEDNLSYEIGDTISLDLGNRVIEGEEQKLDYFSPILNRYKDGVAENREETINVRTSKEYKIVGIIESNRFTEPCNAAFAAYSLSLETSSSNNIYIEFKNAHKAYDLSESLLTKLKLENKTNNINNNLLYYYGATKYDNINDTMLPLIIIFLSVISVGCIIVIYNSFAISAMERKKTFGLFASIGATTKQIKHTVLFEAFIVGVIGIVLGIMGGFIGIYTVVKILNILLKENLGIELFFHVNTMYLVIPLIFMVIVILISAYLPAKKSAKTSPIEAIRGNNDIKITKKGIKTPKFIRKIFGIEGDIAYKNMKRNKKKYRVTIISLFISIVMFNTFTTFLSYFVAGSNSIDNYDFDIGYTVYGSLDKVLKDVNLISDSYSFDNRMRIIENDYPVKVTNLKESDFTKEYIDMYKNIVEDKEINYGIVVLNDEDYAKITNEKALLLTNKYVTEYNYAENSRKTSSVKVFTKDYYDLNIIDDKNKTMEIKAKVYNEEIFGLKFLKFHPKPMIVMSLSTFNEVFNQATYVGMVAFNTKDYQKLYDDFDNLIDKTVSNVEVSSPAIDMSRTRNVILAIKILFYGFITLVVLIGVTSVINTINTSMNLRRKEFAMLRSVGLSPKGFNKMLFFESLLFGLKSLLYGIPVSFAINYLISKSLGGTVDVGLVISWGGLIASIIGVFVIVLIAMYYATKKIKRENILNALREENI